MADKLRSARRAVRENVDDNFVARPRVETRGNSRFGPPGLLTGAFVEVVIKNLPL
jgi:hypothetical protein